MRLVLIAALSFISLLIPAPVLATQVQSPLTVTAVSIWARPATPGSELDPTDPHVIRQAGSLLSFSVVSSGNPVLPQDMDTFYADNIEPFRDDGATVQEVVVPRYGLGSRAANVVFEGLQFEVIVSYDDQHLYLLLALAAENSPSAMPVLSEIADQMFDPTRPDHTTGTMQVFLEGFAPEVDGSYESLLIRLPQRAEVPTEYQMLDEEVIIS